MSEQEMEDRFHDLLPWHINGTLEKDQREWVDQYVSGHPQARAELRWHESLQTKMRENVPSVSPDIGLDRFMARIRQEHRAKTPTLMQRLNAFFSGFGMTPAFAATAVLVLVQAGVIANLLLQRSHLEEDYSAVRSLPAPIAVGPVLQVSFKPEATEREIRLLLVSIGARLVGGPGQLGNYILQVPAEATDAAAKKLQASQAVDVVMVLPSWPQKSE
jgi:hypothetical protein